MLAFEGASFGLAFNLPFLFCGVVGGVPGFLDWETFYLTVLFMRPRLMDTDTCMFRIWVALVV